MAPQETKFNTSFIPKKNPVSNYNSSGLDRKGPSLMSMIGMFFFAVSVVGTIAVFILRSNVENQIEAQVNTLRETMAQFDPTTVEQATILDRRITAVKSLLDNHVAPTIIFEMLESLTLRNVSFRTFNFSTTDDRSRINVEGTGVASSMETIVLQSDAMAESDFRDVLFNNVQPTTEGRVSFSFSASLDKNKILFISRVNNIFSFLYDGPITNNNN